MISSKTTLTLLLVVLLSCLNMKAQKYSAREIDAMLSSARSTLVTFPEKTTNLSEKIYQISIKNDYANGQDYSLLLLNYGYFNSRKFDFVIRNIETLKESATRHSNFEVLVMATLLEARTLGRIQHFKKGLNESKKAFAIIENIDSENSKIIYKGLTYQMIGHMQQAHTESRDSVFRYFLMAKNEFKKVRDIKTDGFLMNTKDDLLYTNYAFLANEFMAKKNSLDSVDYYLNSALKLHPKYKDNISEVVLHNNIAWRFLDKSNFDEAVKNYNISVEISKKYNQKETLVYAYDGLSITYHEMKDYEKASEYANLMRLLQEEVAASNQKAISISVEDLLSKDGTKLKNTNNNLSRIIIIIAILTFLCLYAAFLFYKKFKNEKLTKNEIELLLKEKMEQLSDSEENEVILNKVDIEEIITLAMNDEATFYVKFQEAFPSFKKKLTNIAPTLVTSELKFAAYLKLDFSAKEIARYTNSSVRAVEAKKYRLRKKLNIPSEIDTNVWFSRI